MDALVSYLGEKRLTSNFFWALNEDGTPEGIITDWTVTPPALDQAKLTLLKKLVPHPTNVSALVLPSRHRAQMHSGSTSG